MEAAIFRRELKHNVGLKTGLDRYLYGKRLVERFNGEPGRIDADHFMSSRGSSAHSPAAARA